MLTYYTTLYDRAHRLDRAALAARVDARARCYLMFGHGVMFEMSLAAPMRLEASLQIFNSKRIVSCIDARARSYL